MSLLPSGAKDKEWWEGVAKVCRAAREPPIAPDAFEQRMREGTASGALKFTNGKDATAICIPQYREGFTRLLGATEQLVHSRLGWGPEQGEQLAASLAYAQREGIPVAAKSLHLQNNKLGSAGVEAIGRVIEAGALPQLRTLVIGGNGADADTRTWIEGVARAAGCAVHA